jgi:cysteine desulfurase/selenocysteine lyase
MTLDIKKLRDDTPGCSEVLHFENAGSSLMPTPVIHAVREHLELEIKRGGYAAKDSVSERFEAMYGDIAGLINAKPTEIALLESATRAWTMAFYSIDFKPGDVVLTSEAEYASNYIAMLQLARRNGIEIQVIPSDSLGQVDIGALESLISERVKLIAITHTPTNGGLVNPAEKIGAIAARHSILYLLDACQTVGQYPIDVQKIGCDFLSATGRKYLRGPRGTGFLFVRERVLRTLEPVMLDLHGATWVSRNSYVLREDARRFETWEKNYCDMLGLGEAVRYAAQLGMSEIWKRVVCLADQLRTQLASVPSISVHDLGETKCGIVTFASKNMSSAELVVALRMRKMNCSLSTPFGTRIDMERRALSPLVRASVHYFNTEEEISRFCEGVHEVIKA